MPAAWAASRWIGSPRGYVDPVKEAQGASMRLDNMTSTLEAECAEQGLDFEDVLDQRQYEDEELRRRGLARIGHNGGPPLSDEADDDEEKPEERKPKGARSTVPQIPLPR
jgi:capsid protein